MGGLGATAFGAQTHGINQLERSLASWLKPLADLSICDNSVSPCFNTNLLCGYVALTQGAKIFFRDFTESLPPGSAAGTSALCALHFCL